MNLNSLDFVVVIFEGNHEVYKHGYPSLAEAQDAAREALEELENRPTSLSWRVEIFRRMMHHTFLETVGENTEDLFTGLIVPKA